MFYPTRFLVACGICKNYVKNFEGLINEQPKKCNQSRTKKKSKATTSSFDF